MARRHGQVITDQREYITANLDEPDFTQVVLDS